MFYFLHKQKLLNKIPVKKKITTQNQPQNLQRWKIMNEKKISYSSSWGKLSY